MRSFSLHPATSVKVAAVALASAWVVTACSSGPGTAAAGPTPPPATAASTSQDVPTATGQSSDATGSVKLTGENLLTWSDYSALGMDGLTTRYTAKPGPAALSSCEQGDMRDLAGLESLWQGTAEPKSGGHLMAAQQIASFSDTAGPDRAMELFAQWNNGCHDSPTAHQELDLSDGAHAQTWVHDDGDGNSELVVIVQLPQRASYGVVRGLRDTVAGLDAKAIAEKTAERLS